jgi:hypothetical protein
LIKVFESFPAKIFVEIWYERKVTTRYIRPYELIKIIGLAAYKLTLLPHLARI